MIEVTIGLHDSEELALVHQLMTILEQRRRRWIDKQMAAQQAAHNADQAREDAEDAAAIADHETAGGAPSPAEEAAMVAANTEPEAPVATITGPGAAIKLTDMEKAAQAAIQTGGLAQVRAIVNEYGKSRIREIDASLWPEVLAKLANVKPLVAAE